MRACTRCQLGLTVKDDDGSGAHVTCPRPPDREAYLARRRAKMPGMTELHERLRTEMDTVDNEGDT